MNRNLTLLLTLALCILGFQGNANAASKKCYTMMESMISTDRHGILKRTTSEVNHGKLRFPRNKACRAAAVRDFSRLLGPRGDEERRNHLCIFQVTGGVYLPEHVKVSILWDRSSNSKRDWERVQRSWLECRP